jgi:antirestriction protein ArdC
MSKVHEIITEKIVAKLEEGTIPWRKPWDASADWPCNLISKKPYRGINPLLLGMESRSTQYWLTFNQAKKIGASVRKGEHSTVIIFWTWLEPKSAKTEEEKQAGKIPMLRYYRVFNADQCENIPDKYIPAPEARPDIPTIERCENLVAAVPNPPAIDHTGGNRAYYRPSTDTISLPERNQFHTPEAYYATLFHELTHSTGAETRLNRKDFGTAFFGDEAYSKEELVAEMGAAFLCAETGIEQPIIDNSAAYIASWLKALKNDKRLVVTAAAQAQKAYDYCLNNTFED